MQSKRDRVGVNFTAFHIFLNTILLRDFEEEEKLRCLSVTMENNSTVSPLNITTTPNTTISPQSAANIDIFSSSLTRNVAWVMTVFLSVAILLGVFGNVMTIIIVRRFRAESRSSTMDPYMLMLAVADLCVVITGTLPVWAADTTGFQVLRTHDVMCKTGLFVLNVGAASSAWILVAMTTQRALSVAWPHRVNVLCTPRRSWWIVLTIVVVLCLAYSHLLYGFGILPSAGRACALVSKCYASFMYNIWVNVDIFLFSILPFVCLSFSNSVLVLKLRMSVKDAGDQFATTDTQQASRERKANSVTLTAIVVSVVFVVLTSPLAFYNMLLYMNANPEAIDVRDLAVRFFPKRLFHIMAFFNYSVNFYLYCLTGEKLRKEFRKIMCGWRQHADI